MQVGGELKVKSQSLKWGAFLAVSLVTLLYTLVTLAYVSRPLSLCPMSATKANISVSP